VPKYSDYGTLSSRYVESIAYSRSLEEARKSFGFPPTLPESATLSAAMAELSANYAPQSVINARAAPYNATGLGVAVEDSALVLALAAVPSGGGALYLPTGRYILSADFVLQNRSNLTIYGDGPDSTILVMTGNGAIDGLDHYGIKPMGTCDRVTIKNLRITSSIATSTSRQNGIACPSGQTLTNINYLNIEVDNTILGLSFNCDSAGSITGGSVRGCYVHDIKGGVPGSGYGIHIAKATGIQVVDNRLDKCERHSIYHAGTPAGGSSGNLIGFNTITNHRQGVFDASYRCAMVVSRSNGVEVIGNIVKDGYDGALEISPDQTTTTNCTNVLVVGNFFIGRKNVNAYILVGEQAVPAGYWAQDIVIQSNFFYSDQAGTELVVLNGKGVDIEGNRFRRALVNDAGARVVVAVGHSVYSPNLADIDDVNVNNNRFKFSGTTLTDTRAVQFDGALCTAQVPCDMLNNKFIGVVYPTAYTAGRTNTAMRYYGNSMSDGSAKQGGMFYYGAVGMTSGVGAPAAGTGATGDFYFRQDGGAGTSVYMNRGGWVGIL
jgi:hypothetical protein